MRNIKFRAWDKRSERMVEVGSLEFFQGGVPIRVNEQSGRWHADDYLLMQLTGLKDKKGKEIYEGDIVRWCKLEIEWQTHTGDNIPCGSYTDPCGIISKWETAVVKFIDGEFTILDDDEDSEYTYNWLRNDHLKERKDINYIFFPHYDESRSQQYKDEDFIETMDYVAKDLGISPSSIDEFISMINGVEVIGNIYENPELIK